MTDPTAPERIWLQTDGDYAAAHEAALGTETGVTWCDHNVNEDDAEYIHADLARAQVAAAIEDAAHEGGEAAVSALLRQDRDASPLRQQIARQNVANAIRSLTDADDRAALDRLLAEARAQEREAAWNIPDIELAAILLAYDEAPGCEETFETWRKQWRSRLGQPHDDDTALMDWLGMAQRLAPMVRAAIRARGAAQEGEDSVNEDDAEYLRADLDRAQVAAAYEAAAEMLIDLGHVSESGETLAQEVRALVPDDARAALDRLLDEARAQERDACAKIADFYVNRLLSDDSYEAGRSDGASVIARAIRARGEAATSQGGGE